MRGEDLGRNVEGMWRGGEGRVSYAGLGVFGNGGVRVG